MHSLIFVDINPITQSSGGDLVPSGGHLGVEGDRSRRLVRGNQRCC